MSIQQLLSVEIYSIIGDDQSASLTVDLTQHFRSMIFYGSNPQVAYGPLLVSESTGEPHSIVKNVPMPIGVDNKITIPLSEPLPANDTFYLAMTLGFSL